MIIESGISSQSLIQYCKCHMLIFNQRNALFYLNKKSNYLLTVKYNSVPFPEEGQTLDLRRKGHICPQGHKPVAVKSPDKG